MSSIPKEVVEGGKASLRKGEGGGSKATEEGILFWEEQAGAQQLLDRNTAVGIKKVKTAKHPGTHIS